MRCERGFSYQQESSSAGTADATGLRFTLAVRGDLRPRVSGDGRGVAFVNEGGVAVVNYSGLTVRDATGASVPAWFEEVRDSAGPDARADHAVESAHRLRLVVDDADAAYPLTIDPIAQQAYLKASNTGAFDEFGGSVAVSGDTVVVGAFDEASSATGVNGNVAEKRTSSSFDAYSSHTRRAIRAGASGSAAAGGSIEKNGSSALGFTGM